MPYYVYAIHTDKSDNRLYGKYQDSKSAEEIKKEMGAGNYPGDNYFVRVIFAENDTEAEQKADSLRPYPKRGNFNN
jgi:hypothetical protein